MSGSAVTLAWVTDPHLPHAGAARRSRFLKLLSEEEYNVLIVIGDVGQAESVVPYLRQIADAAGRPVHFVLGNHDFYGGSVAGVRERVSELAADSEHLNYLPASGPVELAPGTTLLGRDGWYDARLGDPEGSSVEMSDFTLIEELRGRTGPDRRARMRELADEEAQALRGDLKEVAGAERVVVATHVPPFAEAAWHEGRPSDAEHLPYFASKATGEVLLEAAEAVPERDLLVLCGHTHGGGELEVRPNLTVWTGQARYGEPRLQRTFEVGPQLLRKGQLLGRSCRRPRCG